MYSVITVCGIFSSLLPIIILSLVYKKAHRKSWWALFFVAFLWGGAEILNWTLSKFSINNMIVFQLFGVLSLIGYGIIFCWLNKNIWFRRILISSIVLIDIFLIAHASFNHLWFQPNMVNSLLSAFVPFLLSIIFFLQLMLNPIEKKLVKYPYYWINTAVLIRFGMAFFALIFIERILPNSELAIYLWPIVSVSNIIYNILFSRGVWMMRRA